MKIAIPANGSSSESGVCNAFGRAPYFMIHDTETNKTVYLENEATRSPDGAGVRASQSLVNANIDVVLTPRCGGNVLRVLDAAKVKIYKTEGESLKDNILAYKDGKLSVLDEIQAGLHGRRS
ncbi:MAG: NifB/NifX family molybdenum-iron cluster-binding protein [Bacillota bacterium]|nr:NifB/NifX family molybdenum-iron cluster-binding protein [Bacillota bacterium]HHU60447.1 dinitrogenase iron-molybdenum cofactor biosynthesis protein [Natronincola sp.]